MSRVTIYTGLRPMVSEIGPNSKHQYLTITAHPKGPPLLTSKQRSKTEAHEEKPRSKTFRNLTHTKFLTRLRQRRTINRRRKPHYKPNTRNHNRAENALRMRPVVRIHRIILALVAHYENNLFLFTPWLFRRWR